MAPIPPLFVSHSDHAAFVLAEWDPRGKESYIIYCPGCRSFIGMARAHMFESVRQAGRHRIEYGVSLPGALGRELQQQLMTFDDD